MLDITIENMVISARVADSVDLERITSNLPDVEYQPENIPGIVIQLTTPRSTVILFADGRIVFTGPKTPEQINEVINAIQSKLLVGIPIQTSPYNKSLPQPLLKTICYSQTSQSHYPLLNTTQKSSRE